MEIRTLAIDEVKPFGKNPRLDLKSGDPEYEKLKRSIDRWDLIEPLVWNERTGNLVGGHQRLKILMDRGDTEVDVSVVDLSEDDEKALNIALNKIEGGWDEEMLAHLIAELETEEFDLSLTGFDDDEIDELLAEVMEEPEPEDDFDPESELEKITEPVTRLGDIWQLGNHYLICGDASEPNTVDRLMAGKQANICFTSPPYADQREYDEDSEFNPIRHDEYVEWFDPIARNVKEILADSGSFFLNIKEDVVDGERSLYVMELVIHLRNKVGFKYIDELIWKKAGVPGGWENRLKNGFEPIFHLTKDTQGVDCYVQEVEIEDLDELHELMVDDFRSIYHFGGRKPIKFHPKRRGKKSESVVVYDKNNKNHGKSGNVGIEGETRSGIARPSNVIEIQGNTDSVMHPAMYSVKLVEWFLHVFTDRGDICFEPFAGSGTNIIACENLGRKCRAVEISPRYCDLIAKRWEEHTGEVAKRI